MFLKVSTSKIPKEIFLNTGNPEILAKIPKIITWRMKKTKTRIIPKKRTNTAKFSSQIPFFFFLSFFIFPEAMEMNSINFQRVQNNNFGT